VERRESASGRRGWEIATKPSQPLGILTQILKNRRHTIPGIINWISERRGLWILLSGISCILLFALPWDLSRTGELATIDYRYRLLPHRENRGSEVMIVGLADTGFQLMDWAPNEVENDPILKEMTKPWPWNRKVFAEIAEKILQSGARLVVFDLVFAGANMRDPNFAEVLNRHSDQIVLGAYLSQDISERGEFRLSYIEPSETLMSSVKEPLLTGYVNTWPDSDNRIRYLTPKINLNNPSDIFDLGTGSSDGVLASLDLAACRALGREPKLDPDRSSSLLIHFKGPPGCIR